MDTATEVDRLTDLALALPPALRELVAYRIWESLRAEDSWPLEAHQLSDLRERASTLHAGTTKLVDGEEVISAARARIEASRR